MEEGILKLSKKRIHRSHPTLAKALTALEYHTERFERGIGEVGKILDRQHKAHNMFRIILEK